jgi:hypothetical protein
MADQGEFDFDGDPGKLDARLRKAEVLRALDAAARLSKCKDADSRAAADAAFECVESLAHSADDETRMLVYRALGQYFESRGPRTKAAQMYLAALEIANWFQSDAAAELIDPLKWDVIRVTNREDLDFQKLLRATAPNDRPDCCRHVWERFVGGRNHPAGRLAARGLGTVENFRELLDQEHRNPDIDEDSPW